MGLVVMVVMGVYLAVSAIVLSWAIDHAKKNGKSVKKWGWGAALVMYMIPFWDLLPTIVADQYYCAAESGLYVYKTLDQWKEQNPGVMGTLSIAHLPEQYRIGNDRNHQRYLLPDGTLLTARFDVRHRLMYVEYEKADGESGVQLNERLRKSHKHEGPGLIKLSRDEYELLDIKTNEPLAKTVNFQMTTKGKIWGSGGDSDSWWKFWFQSSNSCNPRNFRYGGMERYIDSFDTDCSSKSREEVQRDGITISCPYHLR